MGDIILKKLSPAPVYTYHIRNLIDLSIDLEVPVIIYQIPTSPDDDAIGIKVDGNKSVVNISWTLVDEDSTVVSEMTGSDAVETADEQMIFLIGTGIQGSTANQNSLQSSGVDYTYQLDLKDNSGTTFFTKEGIITKVNVSKSGSTPVTYSASIMFSTANMVAKDKLEEE